MWYLVLQKLESCVVLIRSKKHLFQKKQLQCVIINHILKLLYYLHSELIALYETQEVEKKNGAGELLTF